MKKKEISFFLVGSLLAGICLSASAAAPIDEDDNRKMLWPSDETVLRAQKDSSVRLLSDGSMAVKTGVEYDWPGVRMDFKSGEYDLSGYATIVISVSNMTDRTIGVSLSVKGKTVQGSTPGGHVRLKPRASGKIVSDLRNMPWVLDSPLELNGMNGRPSAKIGTTFDVRRVYSMHIFRCRDGTPAEFAVRGIEAVGKGKTPKMLSAKTFLPFVDRFGQFIHDDWPGKLHDESDFAKVLKAEKKWLKKNGESPIPGCDRFGGWAAGPKLKATGHFRTQKLRGKWWLVDPDGHLFFSQGIDCVGFSENTGISRRENYFSWLPARDDPQYKSFFHKITWPAAHGFYKQKENYPYIQFDFSSANLLRKYGPGWQETYSALAHDRLRAWGLNTIGNWSSPRIYGMRRTPYTATLGTYGPKIEGSKGWWGKLCDPFAPEFVENVRKRFAAEAKRSAADPWCIGWFVDNELSWGGDNRELGRALLRSPAGQPAKKAAKELLELKYGTVQKLDSAWGTKYGTWDGFLAAVDVPDEKRCGDDLKELTRAVARRYFSVVRDEMKAVAPDKLYLGARIAWGIDVVYEESARYCDVVSVNIYDRLPSKELPPEAVDKPMINGEFHFGALDRGLFHTGLVGVRDQKERARCYREFVNACLDHPRYVGTHWFKWRDQCLTGRDDGENYQIGFLTITDTPYPEIIKASREVAAQMYLRRYKGTGKRE